MHRVPASSLQAFSQWNTADSAPQHKTRPSQTRPSEARGQATRQLSCTKFSKSERTCGGSRLLASTVSESVFTRQLDKRLAACKTSYGAMTAMIEQTYPLPALLRLGDAGYWLLLRASSSNDPLQQLLGIMARWLASGQRHIFTRIGPKPELTIATQPRVENR